MSRTAKPFLRAISSDPPYFKRADAAAATLLLDHGAAIDAIDGYLSTPLGAAARWGRVDMVTFLLDRGADRRKAGAPWATPLAWARLKGHSSIVKLLER